MNSFDLAIFHFLNHFAHRSYTFDLIVVRTMENGLTTGAVIVALFWAAWEIEGPSNADKRETLLSGLFVSICSIFVARVLALALPFRVRPLHNPDIGFRLPYEMKSEILINWSSFPSDHATLFICLAMVLWMVSRRLGIIAFVYVLLVIDLPRIYSGVHYPTDILAGSLLGLAMATLVKLPKLRTAIARSRLSTGKRATHFCFTAPFFSVLLKSVNSSQRFAISVPMRCTQRTWLRDSITSTAPGRKESSGFRRESFQVCQSPASSSATALASRARTFADRDRSFTGRGSPERSARKDRTCPSTSPHKLSCPPPDVSFD